MKKAQLSTAVAVFLIVIVLILAASAIAFEPLFDAIWFSVLGGPWFIALHFLMKRPLMKHWLNANPHVNA